MALPSIAYSKSVYTAPASDIDGYSAIIDLSNLSADAWTECDSDDATKLRASTDAETELATDTFGYTRASSIGITRVYIGTAYAAASAAARTIRIYLPDSGTASYAASATYGSDNAYDANWEGYWPLVSDANDRTVNSNDGTVQGGTTIGGVTGQLGAATSFDGSDDYVSMSPWLASGATDWTITVWVKTVSEYASLWGQGNSTSSSPRLAFQINSAFSINQFSGGEQVVSYADGYNALATGSWEMLTLTPTQLLVGTTDYASISGPTTADTGTYNSAGVGSFNRGGSLYRPSDGDFQHFQVSSSVRSAAWIAQEYDQTNDNATFWSAWSFVPVGFVYMTATPAAPSADVTDFTFVVDLSLAPTGWWATVDTTDGTRGRVYSADGTTRYAADWIAFDSTGDTGILRLLKPGTHAAAGATAVRVYPPKAANASVLASDTFGSDNAYDSSWLLYAPLDEGAGTAPADRTSNSNDGTFSGAPTWSTGQLGSALDFDGADDYVNFGDSTDFNLTDYTIFASIKADSVSATGVITHKGPGWQNNNWLVQLSSSGEVNFQARESATSDNAFDIMSSGTYDDNAWHNVVAALQDGASTPSAELYVDGASVGTDSGTNAIATSQYAVLIGAYREGAEYFHFDGEIDGFQVHSVRRSAAWISSEDDQTNDNATYWGTWDLVISEVVRYVDPDATGAGNGLSWTDAYTSLSAWEAAENIDLVAAGKKHHVYCRSSLGTADTTPVYISGWTTSADYNIVIEAASGHEALKTGWDNTRYRLSGSSNTHTLDIRSDDVQILGLQVAHDSTLHGYGVQTFAAENVLFDRCRLNGTVSCRMLYCASGSTVTVENSIITSDEKGIYSIGSTVTVTNCVVHMNLSTQFGRPLETGTAGVLIAKNTAYFRDGTGGCYETSGTTLTIDYCGSDNPWVDATNPITASGSDITNEFSDPANGDYSLLSTGNFYQGGTTVTEGPTTDIEGDSWGATPSIGADEYIAVPGGDVELIGSSAGTASISADIEVSRLLDGSVSASALAAAAIQVSRLLAGNSSGVAALTAALDVRKILSGQTDGLATLAAALDVARLLSGTSAGSSSAAADLLLEHIFQGQADGTSSVTGTIYLQHLLSGQIDGAATVAGNILLSHILQGQVDGTSSLTGTIYLQHLLAGDVSGQSIASATIEIGSMVDLAGSIAGAASIVGDLEVAKLLSATIIADATATGALEVVRELAGTISGLATAEGAISNARLLAGLVAGTAALTGNIEVLKIMAGSVTGVASVEAQLLIERYLAGIAAGSVDFRVALEIGDVFAETIIGSFDIQMGFDGNFTVQKVIERSFDVG